MLLEISKCAVQHLRDTKFRMDQGNILSQTSFDSVKVCQLQVDRCYPPLPSYATIVSGIARLLTEI